MNNIIQNIQCMHMYIYVCTVCIISRKFINNALAVANRKKIEI